MTDSDKNKGRLFDRFGRKYSSGEMIFVEDEEAKEVFMVVEGRVRLVKKVRLVERDIGVLKSGDIFGETALLSEGRRPCSAAALGNCGVLAFKAVDFEELLRTQPDISVKLIGQLVRRLQASEERIENMMLRDSQSKIVNTLVKMAHNTQPENGRILIGISPIEMSSRIGIDVDSVKNGILQLKENRYISIVENKIEILNLDALIKLYRVIGMKEDLEQS